MSRRESEEFNFVGLARSPVKRTPRGYAPAVGDSLSGATTARMSTEGSVRSVGSSTSAPSEARRRHKVLQPLAANSMFDNSAYSSGSAAQTPCSAASPLDMISMTISSKKKAVAARRSNLPVSRTLKLSPAVDTARQLQQESVMAEARTDVQGCADRPYSEAAGEHTHLSVTQSALFSALDRLPPTPHGDVLPSDQHKHLSPDSGSLNDQYQDQPSTPPPAALVESGFLGSGISNIHKGRSGVWSDCSFTNAVFSPDPATPRVARGGSSGRGASASVRREQSPATVVSPIAHDAAPSPPADIELRATGSMNIISGQSSPNTAFAWTPAAASALLRMGRHSVGTATTPDSVTADASRYRGSVALSPIATSGATRKEDDERGMGTDVPSTPAAAATLAAMMVGANGSVRRSGTGEEEEAEGQEEEVRNAAEDTMKDDDEKSASTGVQVEQPKQPTPETPSRRESMSARLPIITPRRRKAASQLLDLSKATPKKLIRGILGGWNGPPAHAEKQRQQYTRFVPQVAKLVENVEEETPRTLLKGICEKEDPLDFAASRTRCNSTSVAEAAAAAAAAAASAGTAAMVKSTNTKGGRAAGDVVEDAGGALPYSTTQPHRVASSAAPTAVVVHSGLSAKGVGKGVLVLILLVLLVGGALIVAEDVAVVVCLAFAGPPLVQPIY